jgi:endoglucanase
MTPEEQPKIPRWRGFNLPQMVDAERARPFLESDFEWIKAWGFNFVRLPLSYRCWSEPERWTKVKEAGLAEVDRGLELGRQYGLHTSLNLHRIPGYCVNQRTLEPFDLFEGPPEKQAEALRAASYHWQFLARRYRGIPSDCLSFDLINEPPWMKEHARYVEIVRALVATIRDQDPNRLIVVDGADIGQTPLLDIVDLGVVQSTRGYLPKALTHYTADWVPKNEFESLKPPTWPLTDDRGDLWNRAMLEKALIEPWQPLVQRGVPIHVGEWGAFNRTPHAVTLAWMRDLLGLWKEAGWGWALWNLRGWFGVVDSARSDVRYEDFHGHALDRPMLELLVADGT